MKIILIGNYPLDRQESMERFAQMLASGYREAGVETEIWRPNVLLASWFKSTNSGIKKWIGYIDKWLIFPLLLRWRQLDGRVKGANVHFHLCDHSNSPYLAHLPVDRTIVTCHDVLAIRGALGHDDAFCQASGFGVILQKWILHHLSQAKYIACVSQLTLNQLNELTSNKPSDHPNWKVIHNAFNAPFNTIDTKKSEAILDKVGIAPGTPFILHIGSSLPRKNRKMLIEMIHQLNGKWKGLICFAGQVADEQLMAYARKVGLQEQIISIAKPNHATLVALYNACDAFVFPSFAEGFGWPLIEAQACGAPVIASNIEPLPEVTGGAALHADPSSPEDFAKALLSLQDETIRRELIRNGYINCNRFEPVQMINSYLEFHGQKLSLSR